MRVLKFNLIVALLFGAALAVSCDGNKDEVGDSITIKNLPAIRQTLYADDTSCASVSFTTVGGWSAELEEPSAGEWLSFTPKSGDTAGDYTMEITMTANDTGKTRNAKIIISAGSVWVDVRIEQSLSNRDGTFPGSLIDDLLNNLDTRYANVVNAYNVLDNNYHTLAARSFNLSPTTKELYNLWEAGYGLIDDCNLLLEISDVVQIAQEYQANAHYYRAMSYFYLVTMFGEVPLAITTEYPAADLPRHQEITEIYGLIREGLAYGAASISEGDRMAVKLNAILFEMQRFNIQNAKSLLSDLMHSEYIELKDINKDDIVNTDDGAVNIMPVRTYLFMAEVNARLESVYFAVQYVNILCDEFGKPHALTSAATADDVMIAISELFAEWNTGLKFLNTSRWYDLTEWGYRQLLPIPQQAMDTNSLLQQNPGW